MSLIQSLFYIDYDALYGTFCTLHCIHIFGKMLKINFLKFFHKFPGFDFSSKNSISWKLLRIFHLFLFYSLTCLLYHCDNNSIFAIGYLFMRGVTHTHTHTYIYMYIYLAIVFGIILKMQDEKFLDSVRITDRI